MDGNSSVRRIGTITFLLEDEKDFYLFSINKKIKIEIGFKNFTNKYL
jgi:pyruvate carboxylase